MPAPKRANVEDFFAQLTPTQAPHLKQLRALSLEYVPPLAEALRWNTPAYLRDGKLQWMLQSFSKHCSLRFDPAFFGPHRELVLAAGYEAGEGFVKLPYDRELPHELLKQLIELRLAQVDE